MQLSDMPLLLLLSSCYISFSEHLLFQSLDEWGQDWGVEARHVASC
jgi:hypothetical protein